MKYDISYPGQRASKLNEDSDIYIMYVFGARTCQARKGAYIFIRAVHIAGESNLRRKNSMSALIESLLGSQDSWREREGRKNLYCVIRRPL